MNAMNKPKYQYCLEERQREIEREREREGEREREEESIYMNEG